MGEDACDTGLGLALGIGGGAGTFAPSRGGGRNQKLPVQFHILFPPRPKEEEEEPGWLAAGKARGTDRLRLGPSEDGVVGLEADDGICCLNDRRGGDGSGGGPRKKLRLTKEQTTLLEDTFREHHTLTPIQKQVLADKSNLRPRQVEVWFQNRRARTKVKQTEVDCEFLKRCCESLRDENRRLKKELQELRSINPGSPFYMQLPRVAMLTMCPSCESIAAGHGGAAGAGIGFDAAVAAKRRDSSMAC